MGTVDVLDMAVRDNNKHWSQIHRALSWTFLDSGQTHYRVACGIQFDSDEHRPVSLSSGYLLGALCSGCFGYLPGAADAA